MEKNNNLLMVRNVSTQALWSQQPKGQVSRSQQHLRSTELIHVYQLTSQSSRDTLRGRGLRQELQKSCLGRKEYPGRENSSLLKICRPIIKKGKKPRMKALGRISRQRRPIRVTSLIVRNRSERKAHRRRPVGRCRVLSVSPLH